MTLMLECEIMDLCKITPSWDGKLKVKFEQGFSFKKNNCFVHTLDLLCHREESAALHDALKKRLEQAPTEENDSLKKELQKKRFLKEYPQLKRKLEEHIRKLQDLADHLDEVHKNCTISNVASTSASITSGVIALFLAPITGGTSLVVTAASVGLGAAASVASVIIAIVEESSRISDENEAKRLVGASMEILKNILMIIPKITVKLCNMSVGFFGAWKTLKDQIQASRTARTSARSASEARRLTSTRRISAQVSGQVTESVAHSVSPIARAVKCKGLGFSSIMLGFDVYHLVSDSMDLYGGAKTESAKALRELAHVFKEKLGGFEEIYKALQSNPPK
ncbi:apolipoprotein L3-like [Sigmodon hispidus]